MIDCCGSGPEVRRWTKLATFGHRTEPAGFFTIGDARGAGRTVGLDHGFVNGSPILFETMAGSGEHWAQDVLRRYSTYEQAAAGHDELVREHRAASAAVEKLKKGA